MCTRESEHSFVSICERERFNTHADGQNRPDLVQDKSVSSSYIQLLHILHSVVHLLGNELCKCLHSITAPSHHHELEKIKQ